jgi:hypothetical protein
MATTSSMFMYSLTIQPPSAITQAILGQFAGTKEQQIVTASGSRLTIHRPDSIQGKVSPIFSQDCFGIIRTLAAFRLAGSHKGTSISQATSQTFSDFGNSQPEAGSDCAEGHQAFTLVPAVASIDLASVQPAVCYRFAKFPRESC